MLKPFIFVAALLMPINSASAQTYFDSDYADPYEYADFTDDDLIVISKRFLTPQERGQLATIQARAEQREQQWLAEVDRKAEDAARARPLGEPPRIDEDNTPDPLSTLEATMVAAHPDTGGSTAAFIKARAAYVAARRARMILIVTETTQEQHERISRCHSN